ncbi:electron transport complex subunit RsxC [Salmonella enterica subsp. enterica serovar Choleraesuis]|nr:electron transport complex subunit RsxC [Salmonella enterica subsp. enterica serovar Choleraesuis]
MLRGQPLTRGRGRMLPVHAPTSGTVTEIAPHASAHPSGIAELSVTINADGEDRWTTLDPWPDYQNHSHEQLIAKIHAAGVAGLGGAGFPTAAKLAGGGDKITTLIINAAECEPYITADDRLMQDYAAEVIEGVRILAHILQPQQTLIGIEDNKPQAVSMLRAVLEQLNDDSIKLRVIPTKYPSGGAKQLTQILTGRQVPHGGRSSDIGVLMHNVGTAWAVKRAVIDGEPLTERVVTLTGRAVKQPGNVWARLGTPVRHLLDNAGFQPGREQLVIMGGPLMGFTLPWLDVPVVKITNCLLVPGPGEMGAPQKEQDCIRCSACADACPADLLPQQLYWFSKGQQHDKATAYNLNDCIECGACAWVCPSNIPLVQYFRQEKAEIRAISDEERRTAEARARFEARQARLERDKAARSARHKEAAARPDSADSDAIAAALARAKARNATSAEPIEMTRGERPDNTAAIAAREARKAEARARRAAVAEEATSVVPQTDSAPAAEDDPRKAAVAAAIARAKARKATASGEATNAAPQTDSAPAAEEDPRKAAVAAAIARAKARKVTASGEATGSAPQADAAPAAEEDPRKAAVAAAIARAKARKATASGEATGSAPQADAAPAAEDDPRKAAVAAAIARAKARKATASGEATGSAPQTDAAPAAEDDPRKAAVAAAIARAKARKATASGEATGSAPQADASPAAEDDPRKAAVAAAIARAKARKATASGEAIGSAPQTDAAPAAEEDPRKAAVAAAIARAKARRSTTQPACEE